MNLPEAKKPEAKQKNDKLFICHQTTQQTFQFPLIFSVNFSFPTSLALFYDYLILSFMAENKFRRTLSFEFYWL